MRIGSLYEFALHRSSGASLPGVMLEHIQGVDDVLWVLGIVGGV